MIYTFQVIRLSVPVILASASPRRESLLRTIVPTFRVVPADLDEAEFLDSDPWVTARNLAREKALFVFETHPDSLIIAGDTVVAVEEPSGWVQLAKPASAEENFAFLRQLSGRKHVVITGLALRWPSGLSAQTETTEVRFRDLTDAEIEAYVATGEGLDKAGGYAIQGGAQNFVAEVRGSTSNVVGLPLEMLEEALRSAVSKK